MITFLHKPSALLVQNKMPNNSIKTKQKEFQFKLSTHEPGIDAAWYVINTYSGHEYKVIDALKTRIKTMGLEDYIFQAIVPIQSKMVIRRGAKVKTQEKTFPGYVLIQMIVTDDSWITVRTTQGVTGFIGIGNKPTPISQSEVDNIIKTTEEDKPKFQTPYSIGDVVKLLTALLLISSVLLIVSTRKKANFVFSFPSLNAKLLSNSTFYKFLKSYNSILR